VTTGVLQSKVAVVTGAASGIGRATAEGLARLGAVVAVVDVHPDGAAKTVEAIRDGRGDASAVVADLADADAVRRVVPTVVDRHGRVDILVNAAGVVGERSVLALTKETWDRIHVVNLTAPFLLVADAARCMIEQGGGGRIVNVSSSSAFRAHVGAAYASSKAGLLGLTRAAAGELGPHGINVNAVAPGVTDTPMTRQEGADKEDLLALVRSGPLANLLGRVSEPEDVANVIVFLCTPASRQITGQTIHTSAGSIV
jgi:NAD(P)-dependent dehydrogenase (short-subunit alcohol dehydrogenase family)